MESKVAPSERTTIACAAQILSRRVAAMTPFTPRPRPGTGWHCGHLLRRLRRLDEGHVGAGAKRRVGARDRLIEAEHGTAVGPRDDEEVRIPPGRDRRPNLRQIFVARHD